MSPAIIRCLLCQCGTLESSLELHIKYNHLIYQEALLKVTILGISNFKHLFYDVLASVQAPLSSRQ